MKSTLDKRKLWNQTTRNIVIVGTAVIIAVTGAIINISIIKSRTTMTSVVVPESNVLPFTAIDGKLVMKEVVSSTVPEDAVLSIKDVEGQSFVSNDMGLMAGQPISKSSIVAAKDSKYGQSVELGTNEQFIGVQTDQVRSAGDLIKPGTLADAYVFIAGTQQSQPQLVTPEQDPLLKGLYIQDRQNQNGTAPQVENQAAIPAIAIVKTSNPAVVAALIRYQEEGKVYFSPSGVERAVNTETTKP